MKPMDALRILLVDDHVLFRKGVGAVLAAHEDLELVGEAENGLEAIAIARETLPDIILMDINMPECDGIEAVKTIKAENPYVQIIMLTISDDDADLFAAIRNGASGYLLKNLRPNELYEMLDKTRRGEPAISGSLASRILLEFQHPDAGKPQSAGRPDALTSREIEVLERVARGETNKEIATALFITENTVKIHLRNILEKLHLQNRIQAAVYAVREGLVSDTNTPV